MRVLIVEDEQPLREGLLDLLAAAGHQVAAAADAGQALELLGERPCDLVLLDLMLPDLDGVELCRRLRTAQPDLAVLMLTARGAEDDKVRGLAAGADDYVTKPFGVRELLARIAAFERRQLALPRPPERLEVDGCLIDLGRHSARRGDREVALTPREVAILRWLHRHHSRAVSRKELLERVWGACGDLETRTVDMTVAKLRRKVEADAAAPRIVLTVVGVGYTWGGDDR